MKNETDIHFRCGVDLKKELDKMAQKQGVTRGTLVRMICIEKVEGKK